MERRSGGAAQAPSADRQGAPRTRAQYVRTCALLRSLVTREALATEAEIEAVWPPRGKAAALWEWTYCWAQLCRFLERSQSARPSGPTKEDLAARIINREPVRIVMAGRVVDVTFRGIVSLTLLARHDLARREAERALDRIAELAAETERRRAAGRLRPAAARRRMRHLLAVHASALRDHLHHTQVVLANALTPDGGPVPPEDARAWLEQHAAHLPAVPPPRQRWIARTLASLCRRMARPAAWWTRVTPAEMNLLCGAMFRAGPERLRALGAPPREEGDQKDRRAWREDVGWWSLYGWFFSELGLSPAALSVDVAQFIAMQRFGQPYIPPPKRGKERVH